MSRIFLVRHGQAGSRQNYDCLSDLGHTQARALGDYFAREGVTFHAAWVGGLTRQRQTAEHVAAAYAAVGLAFPAPTHDPAWNEFDLDTFTSTWPPSWPKRTRSSGPTMK